MITTLDALINEKQDKDAKGIKDQMLSPTSILMLPLLVEVLVQVNNFCFLQTRHSKLDFRLPKNLLFPFDNSPLKLMKNDFIFISS